MSHTQPYPELDPSLDAYRFDEQDWERYDDLRESFEHDVPEQFNMVTYLCDRWATAAPDRVALYAVDPAGPDTEHTYGDVHDAATRLATYLAEQGVGRGDRVAVSGAQKLECLVAHLAAWKLGAVSVPLSVRFGHEGLRYRLEDSGATAFVVDEAAVPTLREVDAELEGLETVLTVGDVAPEDDEVDLDRAIEGRSTDVETATTDAEEPAIILYTSGTTGQPKGVVHAHRSLLGNLPFHVTTLRNLALRDDDVLYTPGEWSWIGPMYGYLLSGLYYGTPLVGDRKPGFDPERTLELVERYGATCIAAPTTVYRVLMQVPGARERFDLSSLRVVFEGGETLGQSVVDWFETTVDDVAVHEGYGQTEAGVVVGDCEALGVEHRPGHMGKPVPGSEVRVVDPETSEAIERGTIGELAVTCEGYPGCFVEYWNAPEQTARKRRDGWLLTEDLGSSTTEGYLSFHSRTDDVINSSGYRIGPAEIEECLAGHEAVADAGVIGVPDDLRGEVPKAFVVLAEGYQGSADLVEALQSHAKDRLADYEYPHAFEFVDDLPKTTTGKIRRHDLRRREGLVEAE